MKKKGLSLSSGASPKTIVQASLVGSGSFVVEAARMRGKILRMDFFKQEELCSGNVLPFRSMFLSGAGEHDYVTYEYDRKKWLTGHIMSQEELWYAPWAFSETKCLSAAEKFLGDKKDVKTACAVWQQAVLDVRSKKRCQAKTAKIHTAFKGLKKLPAGFMRFVEQRNDASVQWLFYKREDADPKKIRFRCRRCGGEGVAAKKEFRLHDREPGLCPLCGKPVTAYSFGRRIRPLVADNNFLYPELMANGSIMWRYVSSYVALNFDNILTKQFSGPLEVGRSKMTPVGSTDRYELWDGDWRKAPSNGLRWRTGWFPMAVSGLERYGKSFLYAQGLQEKLASTFLKYSGLWTLPALYNNEAQYWEFWVETFFVFPKLEWIVKMGLTHFARFLGDDPWSKPSHYVNIQGDTIYDILKLSKKGVRTFQALDVPGAEKLLEILQSLPDSDVDFAERFFRLFGGADDGFFSRLVKDYGMKPGKLLDYVERCTSEAVSKDRESKARHFLRDYRDYLEACRGLGFDLRQTYYLFPKPDTFRARHDSVCAQWSIEQDRVRKEKALARDKHLLKVFASAQKKAEGWLTPLNASGSFLIRYPVSADEVRAEGKVLNHCVGSYLDKLDSGQTQVLFIRKKAAPDEPFYTVEFNGGKVIQCRGKHNCSPTDSVSRFLENFKTAAALQQPA